MFQNILYIKYILKYVLYILLPIDNTFRFIYIFKPVDFTK